MPEKELTEKLTLLAGKRVKVKALTPIFLTVDGKLSYMGENIWTVIAPFDQGIVEFSSGYVRDVNNTCITLEFSTERE